MILTFVWSVDSTPRPPPPPILDTTHPDDDTIIEATKEHVGAAATEVILRHPSQDMLNLLLKGLCGIVSLGLTLRDSPASLENIAKDSVASSRPLTVICLRTFV